MEKIHTKLTGFILVLLFINTISLSSQTLTDLNGLETWGKVNENYEMSVAITVSHIFVNGRELGFFYENLQKELDEF